MNVTSFSIRHYFELRPERRKTWMWGNGSKSLGLGAGVRLNSRFALENLIDMGARLASARKLV